MKILYINNTMNIGGIESFLMNVFRNIDRDQHQITFLTYNDFKYDFEDEILKLGGKIIRISNPNNVSILKHIKELYKAIKKEQPDVLHCNTHLNSGYVLLAAKLAKIKIRICHSHSTSPALANNISKKIKLHIGRLLINTFSNKKIACSTEAGEALFGKTKFDIVTNGIEINKYKYNNKIKKEYRQQLKISEAELVIGHIGRLDTPKNHKYLLQIFNEVLKEKPDSKLILVGTGPLEQEIKKQTKKLKQEDKVLFLGNRNDVNLLLNCFDILVFPSIFEGLPVSLVEAQANGLPILASKNISKEIDITETINFLSIEENPKFWAKEILKTKTKRNNTEQKLFNSNYSIQSTIKHLINIYK